MKKKFLLLLTSLCCFGLFMLFKNTISEPSHKIHRVPAGKMPMDFSAAPPLKNYLDYPNKKKQAANQEPKNLTRRAPASVKMANQKNQKWKEKLQQDYKSFLGDSHQVDITPERSVVWTKDGKGLYAEVVQVQVKSEKRPTSSFKALVNAETGKVLETWNQTIMQKKTGPVFRPQILQR